jgi:hypothetical protein
LVFLERRNIWNIWNKITTKLYKNLIFISGDYGNRGRSIFCEYQEENSRIFIANGISNNSFDTILNLNIFKNSFNFDLLELK